MYGYEVHSPCQKNDPGEEDLVTEDAAYRVRSASTHEN